MRKYKLLTVFLFVILIGCNFDLSRKKEDKNEIINNIQKFTPVVFSKKIPFFQKSALNIPLMPVVIRWKDPELYILDQGINSIKVYDEKGKFLRSISSKGAGPHELLTPFDFHIVKNQLYVSDNFLIKVFDKDGSFREHLRLRMRPFKFAINNKFICYCPWGFQDFSIYFQSLQQEENNPHGLIPAPKTKDITELFNNMGLLTSSTKTQRIYFSFILEDRMFAIDPDGKVIFEVTRGLPKIVKPKIKSRNKQEMILAEAINYDIEYYDSSIYLLSVYGQGKNCLFQFDENGKVKRILDHGIPGAFLFTAVDHQTFLIVDKNDFQFYKVVF